MTVAIIGARVMGETLLSGLLRGGRDAAVGVHPLDRSEAASAGRIAASSHEDFGAQPGPPARWVGACGLG